MKKWFWGVFFLLAAAAIVISQVGDFQTLGFWTTLMTVVLLAVVAQSVMQRTFFGVFIPLAILYWVYQEPFRWPEIQFWLLFLSGFFVSIGCSILFKKKSWAGRWPVFGKNHIHGDYSHAAGSESIHGDENHPHISVKLGATTKYLRSDALESARIEVYLGAAEIYFQDATLHPNGADVYIDCNLGAAELFVPSSWVVENDVSATLGAVENNTFYNAQNGMPLLRLHGSVNLGAVEIKRV